MKVEINQRIAGLLDNPDIETVRVEWTPSGGGSVVVAVALVC